ncbi:hypothetical protein SAMD00019534_067230 [Acytostelium subglobosum LB1]|uniref:hypothetical protein n=1 Tax=Acytostelium subglobosum LB1 TaxID=1410327 RepID=UPI000644BFBB|nr:hypothetical protein SAMD00019534_067230 [Acytostelium subglobosum LB1]GAM23548.1 hypothetical protein SAMD00019534_067230 [Acytostelium subglobosum LB1]|eukprot:XP_012753289.1 hypothetical protein SAMD00019534_067230 [Acytostelium subglobosum LB1]
MAINKLTNRGYLFKRGRINTKWQKRWFMLGADSRLCYSRSPSDKGMSGYIQLMRAIISIVPDVIDEYDHCFNIITPDRVYYMAAETKVEMDEWIKIIETHSFIKAENDLMDEAEFNIREYMLKRSNMVDHMMSKQDKVYNHLKANNHPTTPMTSTGTSSGSSSGSSSGGSSSTSSSYTSQMSSSSSLASSSSPSVSLSSRGVLSSSPSSSGSRRLMSSRDQPTMSTSMPSTNNIILKPSSFSSFASDKIPSPSTHNNNNNNNNRNTMPAPITLTTTSTTINHQQHQCGGPTASIVVDNIDSIEEQHTTTISSSSSSSIGDNSNNTTTNTSSSSISKRSRSFSLSFSTKTVMKTWS